MSSRPFLKVALAATLLCTACGDDGAPAGGQVTAVEAPGEAVAYGDDQQVIITDDATYVTDDDPAGCVQVVQDCIDVAGSDERYCEPGAQMDVIVVDGEIVSVICYPPDDGGTEITEIAVEGEGTTEIPQNDNGAVVVFDESTNGEPIEGDLKIDAERLILYGNGADNTVIDGNLTLASNNSRVRGLRVTGNLKIESNANNSALSFLVIEGNLDIDANNVTIASVVVHGNVNVKANGTVLVDVQCGGEWKIDGSDTVCDGTWAFDDANDDLEVTDDEIGDELLCEAP